MTTVVAGIVERHDGCVLICRPRDGDGPRCWELPGGLAGEEESPEAAMRRLAIERAGIRVFIDIGQPPLMGHYQDREVQFRFFLCTLGEGEARALDYAEVRWVPKGQLCEHEYAAPMDGAIRWYAE